MSPHHQQFEAIQAMLAAGHRCVHLERHTLLLLGGVGGFLSVATEWVITAERFPGNSERGLALLAWLAFWLGGMSLLELRWTRLARQRRAETLPFAQAQITRAWWMLLAVGCLGSFAMFFYGGGAMIYALWTVLLGLGIYLFGLFSRPFIEWVGLATILLGVAGLAAGLPYGATRWLNASCFAVGLPLAGWLNARLGSAGFSRRAAALAAWLLAVALPPLPALRLDRPAEPTAPPVAAAAATGRGEEVVRLAAGNRIPLRLDLESTLLAVPPGAELGLTLTRPLEVALRDGEPDGRYRLPGDGGEWHRMHDGALRLSIDRLAPRLTGGTPEIRTYARFDTPEAAGERR